MFAEISMFCFLISFLSAEPLPSQISTGDAKDLAVTIRLDGENARRYSRLLQSKAIAGVLEQKGVLMLDAVVKPAVDGKVVVHHTAFVRIEGEPLQVLSLETAVDQKLITPNPAASSQNDINSATLFLKLTDGDSLTFKRRNVVGGFPDAGRYH